MVSPIIFLLLGYKEEIPNFKLKQEIESFYHIKMTVKKADLPKSAYYSARNRYRADSILTWLKKSYPNQHVVAITSVDISTSKNGVVDYGIFGLGSLNSNVCVTSVYRLKSKNLKTRTVKVLLHEIGHTRGIQHCITGEPCLMKAGDHTAKGLDKEPIVLCKQCRQKAFKN